MKPYNLTRRAILLSACALPALTFLSLPSRTVAKKSQWVGAASPLGLEGDLKNPREIVSTKGRFKMDLPMQFADIELPYASARIRTYMGEIPGPTIRVSPGDEMEIALHNNFPENTDEGPVVLNTPNEFNSTNLHFHGFHVSPKGNSDNVYLQINPGESFNYVVRLPEDHPAGNYWYHPHRHGSVAVQVASGCAGMMIVEGGLEEVPEIADAVERIMVFQAPIVDTKTNTLDSYNTIWDLSSERYWLINGEYKPEIYMREGEVQHWRILNAGDEQFLPMVLDGLEIWEIGFDGNPYVAPEKVSKFEVAPGNRINLLVKALKAGAYVLDRPGFNQGKTPIPHTQMADIIVLPASTDKIAPEVKMSTRIPERNLPLSSILTDVTDSEIVRKRTIKLGAQDIQGMFKGMVFTLNGEPFDPERNDIEAKLGDAEEWEFVNLTPYPHPIHIHVNPMQVIAINGKPVSRKHWQDTIAVPAAGSATVRMRYTEFDGRFVMHCHILPHEDLGMMLNVNISK